MTIEFDLTPIVEAAREEDDSWPEEYDANVRETQRQCGKLMDAVNRALEYFPAGITVEAAGHIYHGITDAIVDAYVIDAGRGRLKTAVSLDFGHGLKWAGKCEFCIKPGDVMKIEAQDGAVRIWIEERKAE